MHMRAKSPSITAMWLILLGLLGGMAGVAAEPQRNVISLNGHRFQVPAGLTVDRIAGPPLVHRPITADFDDQGRLYVADSSGTNARPAEQWQNPTHKIVRLEDTNGDGVFDRSVVFADKLAFPEGTLWYEGSLYVAVPPKILKLTDTSGDGVADRREVWFDGKTLTGCANDLHGPYRGPDGYLYWCKGAFAEQTYTLPNGKPFTTKASHIFRAKPDGTGVEPVMTGGMDNPVDVVFTTTGERILSCTFLQHPAGGLRDGLIHAVYGGVYGKDHDPIYAHPWTGPNLLPPLSHLGAAAPCGLHRYDHAALGREYTDNIFCCLFNMAKVTRHQLVPHGATFQSIDSDFLVSDNRDFHPTDVLEAPDGSLIVVDTGGWYKMCCPTSQLAKEDILGAIYRVRKVDAKPVAKPAVKPLPRLYHIALNRDKTGLKEAIAGLKSDDRHRRRLAAEALGRIGEPSAIPAILDALSDEANDRVLEHSLIYALIEIAEPKATAAGLRHPSFRVQQAAMIALDQMPGGQLSVEPVAALLNAPLPEIRETAWWIAGRHPEWGAALADVFRTRIASSTTPAEQQILVEQLAKSARSPAVQSFLADLAGNHNHPTEIRRLALRAMLRSELRQTPASWLDALSNVLTEPSNSLTSDAIATLKALNLRQMPTPARLNAALTTLAANKKLPAPIRFAALTVRPGSPQPISEDLFAELLAAIHRDQPADIRSSAADLLAKSRLSPHQLRELASRIGTASPMELDRFLAPFATGSDEAAGLTLLETLQASPLRSTLRVDMLAPRLANYPASVRDRAEALYAVLNADRAKQQARLEQLLLELPQGDIRRGQAVFTSTKAACMSCHAMGYLGGKVGPDLTRIGSIRTRRDLLESILYPSASFVRSYEPWKVTTLDGRVFNGLLARESADEVVLRITATEEVRIPRNDIDELTPGTVSIMPAGLEQQLNQQELADLLAFLQASK